MEREHGDIFKYDAAKRFGFIENREGEQFLFTTKNVRPDPNNLSRAWSFLSTTADSGIPVTFIKSSIKSKRGHTTADDVAPLFGFEKMPTSLADLREVMIVRNVIHDYGWAVRACGDEIFIHVKDVAEHQSDRRQRWELLKSGVPIYAGVKQGSDGLPRAAEIELYSAKELEQQDQVVDSDLLSIHNRNKTLYQLIQEKTDVRQVRT
jgi:hypothetical protein